MKIPVSELSVLRLTLLVAQCDPRCTGLTFEKRDDHWAGVAPINGESVVCAYITLGNAIEKMRLRRRYDGAECYEPAGNWAQGGPIIELESISVTKHADQSHWWAGSWDARHTSQGPTALIAAMRCYVASKLGNEIEIPEITE